MKSWCNYGKDRLNGFKWEDTNAVTPVTQYMHNREKSFANGEKSCCRLVFHLHQNEHAYYTSGCADIQI